MSKKEVTTVDIPYQGIVTKADPDFYRDKARELEYQFQKRNFYANRSKRGAYDPNTHLEPTNTRAPSILGVVSVGALLTLDPGTWTGNPTPTLHYQWLLNGYPIAGATGLTYTYGDDAIGQIASVAVSGISAVSKPGGTIVYTPNYGPLTKAAPTNVIPDWTSPPYIQGVVTENEILTINAGVIYPAPTTVAYQWLRDGVAIVGAGNNPTYRLVNADVAHTISATVTASNLAGTNSRTTSPTPPVHAALPPDVDPSNTQLPKINGGNYVGNQLTADPGIWVGYPATTFAYQWEANDVPIPGATGLTYTTTASEAAKTMKVIVTGTNRKSSAVATSLGFGPILTSQPAAVTRIGMNLSGMEYGSSSSFFTDLISDAILTEIYAKGFRDIRVPLSWDRLFPIATPTTLSTVGYGNLKDLLTRAAAKGMTVIVDIHAFGARDVRVTNTSSVLSDTSFSGYVGEDATPVATGFIEGTNTFYGIHRIRDTFQLSAGTAVATLKIKKYQGTGYGRFIIINDAVSAPTVLQPQFDLNTGALTPGFSTTNGTASISGPDADGYYTVTLNYNVPATGSYRIYIEANAGVTDNVSGTNLTYTGDGVSQPFLIKSATVTNTSTSDVYSAIGSINLPISRFADNWKTLVTQIRADGLEVAVAAYDLMNEPVYVGNADTLFNAAQASIYAIRQTGSTACILVEGLPYSGAHTFWDYNPNLHLLQDPANNWMISVHDYGDWDNSGAATPPFDMSWAYQGGRKVEIPCDPINNPNEVVDEMTLVRRLDKAWQGAKSRGLTRIHMGEGGVGRDSIHWTNQIRNLNAYAVTNKVWISWWAGGDYWGDGYLLRLTKYSDGIQAEQMVAFDDYFGNPAPTTYRVLVPTRIANAATTIPVTITYNGRINSPITFTPVDNNGGTFSPATLTTDVTENWTGTTYLTPVANKNSIITSTNNRGLTDPAGVPTSSWFDSFTATEEAGVTTGPVMSVWRRYYKSYTGPLVRLWRSSDSTEADIPFVPATGLLDRTAEAAFTAGGGTIRIKQVYDQRQVSAGIVPRQNVENGSPAVSPTDYPLWISDAGNGKPVGRWTGSTYMDIDYAMEQRSNTSVIFVGKHTAGTNCLLWQFQNRFLAFPTVFCTQDNVQQVYPITTGQLCQTVLTRKRNSSVGMNGWLNGSKTFTSPTLDNTIQVNPDGASGPDYRNGSMGYYRFTFGANTWSGDFIELALLNDVPADGLITPFFTDADATYGLTPAGPHTIDETTPTYSVDFRTLTATNAGASVPISNYVSGTLTTDDATRGMLFDRTHGLNVALIGALKDAFFGANVTYRITLYDFASTNYTFLLYGQPGNVDYIHIKGSAWEGKIGPDGISMGGVGTTGKNVYVATRQQNGLIRGVQNGYVINESAASSSGAATPLTSLGIGIGNNANTYQGYIAKIEVWTDYTDDVDQTIRMAQLSTAPGSNLPTWWNAHNFSGMDFSGADIYPANNATDYYQGFGMNMVRLPFLWQRVQPALSSPLSESEMGHIDSFVTYTTGKGVRVLLDMHNYGSYDNGTTAGAIGQSGSPITGAMWNDAWVRIATRYKDNPLVDIDLMNEPVAFNGQASLWVSLCQSCINAIRAAGFTGYIHFENGEGYGPIGAYNPKNTNAALYAAMTDGGLGKLIFHGHQYMDSDGSGRFGDIRFKYEGKVYLKPATDWARANGLKLFVGETGVSYNIATNADQWREWKSMVDFMYANRDVWTGFAQWGSGPYWGNGYVYNTWPDNYGQPTQTDKPALPYMAKYPGYTGADVAPTAGYQLVANRVFYEYNDNIYYPSYDSSNAANNTDLRRLWFRTSHFFGGQDVVEFRLLYDGYRGTGPGGDVAKVRQNVQAGYAGSGSRTIKVGVHFKGTPVGDKVVLVTWAGASTKNIPEGGSAVISDPILPSTFGWAAFPANTQFWVNYQEDQPNTGVLANAGGTGPVFWHGGMQGLSSLGEWGQLRKVTDPEVWNLTTQTNPTGCFNHMLPETPRLIIGKFVQPEVSCLILGDSLIHSGGFETTEKGDGTSTLDGYAMQAMMAVNGRKIPYAMWAKYGGNAHDQDATSPNKKSLAKYFTHAVCNHFHNNFVDNPTNLSYDLTLVQNYNAAAGKNLYWVWINTCPETTSTDDWATTANQSFDPNFRIKRDYVDAGLNAAVGTLLNQTYDFTPIWSPVDKNKWRVNGLGRPNGFVVDGTHYGPNLCVYMGPAFRADVTSHWTGYGSTTATVALGTEKNVSALTGDLTNVYQIDAAIDPTNAAHIVLTAKYGAGAAGETQTVAFTSNDAFASVTRVVQTGNTGEPDVQFEKTGIALWSYLDRTNNAVSLVSKVSGGTTWASRVTAAAAMAHPVLLIDKQTASPFYNRTYVAGTGTGPVISHSDDRATWVTSPAVTLNAKFNAGRVFGGCTTPGGVVLFPYKSATETKVDAANNYAGTTADYYVLKSTNGGGSFKAVPIYTTVAIASDLGPGYDGCSNMAYTPPTVAIPNGRLHLLIVQAQAGGLSRLLWFTSDDLGESWTGQGRYIGDVTGYGAAAPFLASNRIGTLLAQFYAASGYTGTTRVYCMASNNSGTTWSTPTKLNSVDGTVPLQSSQALAYSMEQGYGAVSTADGRFLVAWASHTTGNNVYAAYARFVTVS